MKRLATAVWLALAALALGAAGPGNDEARNAGPGPAAGPAAATRAPAAVGILALPGGRGSCTATLIAPDLVLTAAHCLLGRDERDQPFPARAYVFRPARGQAPDFRARKLAVHPAYGLLPPDAPMRSARDLGLLRLLRPVPASLARPLPLASDRALPRRARLVTRRADRPGGAMRDCPLRRLAEGIVVLGCAVAQGDSGGAVLTGPGGAQSLFAVVSSRASAGARTVALLAPAAGRLELLIGVLRAQPDR